MNLPGPDRTITERLAATAARRHGAVPEPGIAADRARIAAAVERAGDTPRWRAEARSIGAASGTVELPGTGLRAPLFGALRWCGAVLADTGPLPGSRCCLLAGLIVGEHLGRAEPDIGAAVAAGTAVNESLRESLADAGPLPAVPSVAGIGVAVTTALLADVRPEQLADVIDLAASLMVLDAPGQPDAESAARTAGEVVASGWLAVASLRCGVTPLPGALAETIGIAAGRTVLC